MVSFASSGSLPPRHVLKSSADLAMDYPFINYELCFALQNN